MGDHEDMDDCYDFDNILLVRPNGSFNLQVLVAVKKLTVLILMPCYVCAISLKWVGLLLVIVMLNLEKLKKEIRSAENPTQVIQHRCVLYFEY